MTPENIKFFDNFSMQDNTYTDESDFHFTFLIGECDYQGRTENVWADMSGYISDNGNINVYSDDDFKGYVFDENRINETLVNLPQPIMEKLSELTEQAIEKSNKERQEEVER